MALADRLRPKNLDEIIGQEHIIGKGKLLRNTIESNTMPHIILYGPPGTGKTSLAEVIAKLSSKNIYKLNGISASTDEIREVLKELDTFNGLDGILFFLDEIGYLNTRQQQVLLERLEEPNSKLTLIGATTQNPYNMHKALLSRCVILEFKPLKSNDIIKGLKNAIKFSEEERNIKIDFEEEALKEISIICEGDMRSSINYLELVINGTQDIKKKIAEVKLENLEGISFLKVLNSDVGIKYDLLSALQDRKSVV